TNIFDDVVFSMEFTLFVDTEQFLSSCYYIITKGGTVNANSIQLNDRIVPNNDHNANKGRASGLCLSVLDSFENGDHVFTRIDGLHVPAISLVAGVDIFGESNVGVIFDGDAVVIPKDNEVAQIGRAHV